MARKTAIEKKAAESVANAEAESEEARVAREAAEREQEEADAAAEQAAADVAKAEAAAYKKQLVKLVHPDGALFLPRRGDDCDEPAAHAFGRGKVHAVAGDALARGIRSAAPHRHPRRTDQASSKARLARKHADAIG